MAGFQVHKLRRIGTHLYQDYCQLWKSYYRRVLESFRTRTILMVAWIDDVDNCRLLVHKHMKTICEWCGSLFKNVCQGDDLVTKTRAFIRFSALSGFATSSTDKRRYKVVERSENFGTTFSPKRDCKLLLKRIEVLHSRRMELFHAKIPWLLLVSKLYGAEGNAEDYEKISIYWKWGTPKSSGKTVDGKERKRMGEKWIRN